MSHYYSSQTDTKSKEFTIQANLRGLDWTLTSDHGVFSKSGVDFGSRLLIETVQLPTDADILDLGCGYGVIGIVLASLLETGRVTFADINQRSLSLAEKNARAHRLDRARFYLGDGFAAIEWQVKGQEQRTVELDPSEGIDANKDLQVDSSQDLERKVDSRLADESFTDIFLNPPIRTGKAKIYELFGQAKFSLKPGGNLWIVINKKQGADSAYKYLKSIYPRVEILAKKSGYQIIRAQMDLSAYEIDREKPL